MQFTKPRLTIIRAMTRLKGGVLVFSGEPAGDLIEAVKRHRGERAKRVGGVRRKS